MNKKAYLLLTVALLLICIAEQPVTIFAEKNLKEIREQREEIKKDLSEAEAEVATLVAEINEINFEINALNETLKQNEQARLEVQKEKDEVQREIDILEDKIKERFDILNERMKSYQFTGGNVSYLEVILGAKSFTDFISRVQAITQITDSDAALITKQRKDKEAVDNKMNEIENIESELLEMEQLINEQKDVAIEMKQELENKNKELESVVTKLKKEDRQLAEIEAEWFDESATVTASMMDGNGLLGWPASSGYISSYYGQRWGKLHKGIDIARTDRSTSPAILAAEDGTIEEVGFHQGGYGNRIVINHENGIKTLYAHLASTNVSHGQQVKRGEKIGVMGTTGSSTGIHLHFEVYENGEVKNPLPYLR